MPILQRQHQPVGSTNGLVKYGFVGLVGAVGLAVMGGSFLWTPNVARLSATLGESSTGVDEDHDGFPDAIELQYGCSTLTSDSDGDGVSDLVECIQGSKPFTPLSAPSVEQLQTPATRVFGYLSGVDFHLFVAVYVPGGTMADIQNAGALMYAPTFTDKGPTVIDLNSLVLAGAIDEQPVPGGGVVVTSDSSFPQDALNLFTSPEDHYLQFCTAFSATVGGKALADVAVFTTTATYDTTFLSLATLGMPTSASSGASGAFRPLQPASLPPGWIPNSACVVTTELVGVELGTILVLQTTSADCQPLIPALCSPASCHEQLGRIFKVIDPCCFGVCR